jgi:hypothetical protein
MALRVVLGVGLAGLGGAWVLCLWLGLVPIESAYRGSLPASLALAALLAFAAADLLLERIEPDPPASAGPWPLWLSGGAALVPPLFWAACVWLAYERTPSFLILVQEDGWIENLQVLLFAVCAVVAAVAARSLRRGGETVWAALYAVVALGLFAVVGEEISWGQRVLGIETPAWYAEHNVQGETTLHNLPGVSEFVKRVLYFGALLATMLAAAAGYLGRERLARWRVAYWCPPIPLIPAFLCMMTWEWMRRAHFVRHGRDTPLHNGLGQLQEARELVLAFVMVAFLAGVLLAARTPKSAAPRRA